jgi:sensor domain CHASE-containing protein
MARKRYGILTSGYRTGCGMNDRTLSVLALILGPLRDSNEAEGLRQVETTSGGCRFSTDPRWFDVGMVTFAVTVPIGLWEMVINVVEVKRSGAFVSSRVVL